MTWSNAKEHALRLIETLNLPDDLHGSTIQLTDFEDEACLRFLKPDQDWGIEFHRMVNRSFSRELRKRGAKVEIIVIQLSHYFDWLVQFGLENTTANRAQYIGWVTAPEPKPTPLK